MNLRTKVFLSVGGTLLLAFLLMLFFTSYTLTKDFSGLEQREMHKNLSRASDALNEKIDNLSIKLGDWAQWDDTYQYIDDHNEDFIQSNLQNNSFDVLKINFVVLVDKKNQVVFKKFVKDGEEQLFPASFEEHLIEDSVSEYINPKVIHKEIVQLPEGIIIYSARPITSSDGLSPTRGFIVFGYTFNEGTIQELSQLTHLDTTFTPYKDDGSKGDFATARENLSVEEPHFIPQTKDENTISGYVLVSDEEKIPAIILRVSMAREIYQQGQGNIHFFAGLIILAGIIFTSIIFYFIGRFVLNKLAHLSKGIDRIRQSANPKDRIVLPGKDEFSRLAVEMNDMLKSLREKEDSLQNKTDELRKFQQIADSSFDHTIITDSEGVILYANHAAEILTGYSREEILGEKASLWGNQMPKTFYETLWKTIKTEKQSYAGELTNKRKDGTTYLVSMRVSPILDEKGKIKFFVGIERDITEERQSQLRIVRHAAELETANASIEKQKERAESILRFLKSIGEGIFATDISGRVIFMNETAEVLSKKTFMEAELQPANTVFCFAKETDTSCSELSFVMKALEKKKTITLSDQTVLIYDGKKRIPVSGTCAPIRDTDNVIIGTITVFQDITKRHELDKMKDSFLSVAAHQLRTPLGSMRWSMELLLSGDLGKLPKAAQEGVQQLYDNSQRMVLLVNDLLDISRIEQNRGGEEKKLVNIEDIVKGVRSQLQAEADKRDITIKVHIIGRPLPNILLSPKHTHQALENLLSNAIKYNSENGKVTITIAKKGAYVELSIADTGIGIPKEDQGMMFSKFFRAQNAVTKETEGSGLGLSVVKSYLNENGASISFKSEENVGTTFFIEFPLDPTNGIS